MGLLVAQEERPLHGPFVLETVEVQLHSEPCPGEKEDGAGEDTKMPQPKTLQGSRSYSFRSPATQDRVFKIWRSQGLNPGPLLHVTQDRSQVPT